jgi:hypothetical protein
MTDIRRSDFLTRIQNLQNNTARITTLNSFSLTTNLAALNATAGYTILNEENVYDYWRPLSASDIALASAAGIGITYVTSSPTVGSISAGDVGEGLISLLSARMVQWTRIRRVRWTMTGNTSPGSYYEKYAYIPGLSTSYPTTNARFDPIRIGQPAALSAFDTVISGLATDLNSLKSSWTYNISFCHSSCHSNCHSSRGRR